MATKKTARTTKPRSKTKKKPAARAATTARVKKPTKARAQKPAKAKRAAPRPKAPQQKPVSTVVTVVPVKAVSKTPVPADPAVELAQGIAALALDKKAEDVVILKVTDLTSYADCFILASAPSERQVQAIARHVADEMRKAGKAPVGTEGLEQGHWVLVDLGAAVLHVFLANARQYYDLEGFWADAPRVDVDEARGKDVVVKMTAARAARDDDAGHAAAANE